MAIAPFSPRDKTPFHAISRFRKSSLLICTNAASLWLALCIASLFTSPRILAADAPAALPLPTSHENRKIEGWTVLIDQRLLNSSDSERKEAEAIGARAIRLLTARLVAIEAVVPEKPLQQLRRFPIQLDLTHGELWNMQYHPSKDWLTNHGYSATLEKTVHIPKAEYFLSPYENLRQPTAVLHELAHAYHDQVLGFDHPKVEAAWNQFRSQPKFQKVLTNPHGRRQHYALTDAKEFFAEMTECYFGVNDFFPFVSGELKEEAPEIFALMEEIWGPLPRPSR